MCKGPGLKWHYRTSETEEQTKSSEWENDVREIKLIKIDQAVGL